MKREPLQRFLPWVMQIRAPLMFPCLSSCALPKSSSYLLSVWGHCYREWLFPDLQMCLATSLLRRRTARGTFGDINLSQTNAGCCPDAASTAGKIPVCGGSCGDRWFVSSAMKLEGRKVFRASQLFSWLPREKCSLQ